MNNDQLTGTIRDRFARTINYLRLSITDLCNLQCFYCMPTKAVHKLDHSQILRYEECIEVVRVAARLGVHKVRITGGEPLIKRSVTDLVRKVAACPGIETVALTTNGVRLAALAPELKAAGLQRINISLDTFDPEFYRQITGVGDLQTALNGIDRALEVGLKVKINAVLLREINIGELATFVRFARDKGVEVRFIERMSFEDRGTYFSQDEAIERLSADFDLKRLSDDVQSPHVNLFDCDGARIGFISPRSRPFCSGCNKLRLTPHGQLRACLASNVHVDLRAILRRPHTDTDIQKAIIKATSLKPQTGPWDTVNEMWRVGG